MFPVAVIKPKKLSEIAAILKSVPGKTRFLAGGTDLCIAAHCGFAREETWLDISGLKELRGIKIKGKSLYIGAGEKVADIERSALVEKHAPVLFAAVHRYASPTLRNMATLGGNCANASPSADGACALVAESASVFIRRGGKTLKMPVEKLFKGPKCTVLAPGDLITGFEIPLRRNSGVYMKLSARKSFSISKICMGVSLNCEKGIIVNARIAMGAVGPTIKRALEAEKLLEGSKPDIVTLSNAAQAAMDCVTPIDDQRSSAEYRRAMVGVLLKRAVAQLCGGL